MLLSGSFGLYLFSFSDFDTKIQEGEQIEAKTTRVTKIRIRIESGVWTREQQKIFFPTFRDKERGTQSLQLAGCLYQS